MRNITLFIAFASLAACSKKFVTLYPEGQVNEGNFFKSASDFQEALAGAYAPLRSAANVAFYLEEMRADNTFFDYNAKDRGGSGAEELAEFLDNSANTTIQTLWTADYQGIQRTNIILDKMASPPADMNDSAKNQVIGQAEALRAHYYFELVRLFGSVPLYLHEVTDAKNAVVNRSPVDAVYTQIEADLTDALGRLSPPSKWPQSGAITRGMVATELGLVYLTLKQYDKAAPLFQSVTQMGYALLPNYADVFKTANKNSTESVFEVQYKSGTDGQASQFIYYFIPTTPATGGILGASANYNNTEGSWNIPTQDLINSYEPGDTRLDASIGVIKGHLNAQTDFIPDSVVSILANLDTAGKGYGYTTSLAHRFIKKQFNPPYNTPLIYNTDDDWPVYRYSDVLMMLAESLNEQGQPGAALPYLNMVRMRAGLPASTAADQGSLRDTIAHERRVELAFENHRWFDLLRTGQAIPVMTGYGVLQKQAFPFLLPSSYNVAPNKLIYAIPFRETQVNPGLGQNPGY
ncbi:MAG TPA: RagB/SusD family nutrient uptake outer membrane protein [Puia sp.]|uniref:RagB/SusD family nutrient uptake outer membrane protein n=1 Tax=Puia sp. TaxID=2045100 RepID=UPI002C06BFAB|nr:RagB/SusD family nutrient uptake outer membrane protein [Puia sp.]HVU94029.1 RagB/SusD family nutrient uptake outer membrane protein [Puia sp.]